MTQKQLTEEIKKFRKEKGWTQEEAAKRLKCSVKHYCNVENEKSYNLNFLRKVLNLYGLEFSIEIESQNLKAQKEEHDKMGCRFMYCSQKPKCIGKCYLSQ